MSIPFPDTYFRRQDESDDDLFYLAPRKVVHIDDAAIAAASKLYGELLPSGGHILDLMSAWRTHLPISYQPGRVTGLGMNADEMRDNPQLSDFNVQNLNKDHHLPYADQTFDGAICTVSVQYLVKPVEVFRELFRVLRPNSPAVFTFSNRCFPTKAVAVWHTASMNQKAQLVAAYLEAAGFVDLQAEDRSPRSIVPFMGSDPLIGVWGFRPASDL